MTTLISIIGSVIRTSTPLLLVALGVLFVQSCGILEMAAEGKMLIGAFCGVAITYFSGNVWAGMFGAAAITGLTGLVFAVMVQEFEANQTVLGIAFNMLVLGATTALYRIVLNGNSMLKLDDFEFTLFSFSPPVYLAFALIPVVWWLLWKTRLGLMIRAVGEKPEAIESMGLSVKKIRYISTLIGSVLIGFGGAFLSLGITGTFVEDMVGGKGYIAMAAVTFGNYTPLGVLAAVLIFGLGDSVQYRLQLFGNLIPSEVALMLPYIMTILALAGFVRNVHSPSSLGKPYRKSR